MPTIVLPDQISQLSNPAMLDSYSVPRYLLESFTILPKSDLKYRFLVLSGPSGVGKSHLLAYVRRYKMGGIDWKPVRRVTTRTKRLRDRKEELSIVAKNEFAMMEKRGDLMYSELYAGNQSEYGLSIDELLKALREGVSNTIFVIIGTLALSKILPRCTWIYILPPSLDELRRRIEQSQKPNMDKLFSYGVQEMKSLVDFVASRYSENFQPFSVICNESDRLHDCAEQARSIVWDGRQIVQLPSRLLTELSRSEGNDYTNNSNL
jgi:guanylate kinase